MCSVLLIDWYIYIFFFFFLPVAVRSAKNEAEQHYRKDQNETDTLNADLERMRHEILKLEAENYYLPWVCNFIKLGL